MRELHEIHLAANDRTAIERAAQILRAQFPVERIILFGSKARGDDQPDSDIDLLVLTREEMNWHRKRAMTHALFDLELELRVMLSPVVIERNEWEHGVSQALPLHDEVKRVGQIYSDLFAGRQEADYGELSQVDAETAVQAVQSATAFVAEMKRLMGK